MKDKKEKVAMLYELKDRIKSRLMFVENSGLPDSEIAIMKKENEILLRVVDKIITNKLKPNTSIETVRGVSFKIGDTFCINGNEKTKYEIDYFPDSVTVRGIAKNPTIGDAWTVEAYIEDIFKSKKMKKVKPVRIKKTKPIEINKGDYFALRTNNTVYKATKVKKEFVHGTNELKAKNTTSFVKAIRSDIVLKTKKDYKKQHKAERKYKE